MAEKLDPKISYVSLIMAGGSGTRFWPLSKPSFPKQYLKLFGNSSLIQDTESRLRPLQKEDTLFISSGVHQRALLQEQLPQIKNLILEPVGRNTAPCLMLSVRELLRRGYKDDTVMGVFPADHYIANGEAFRNTILKAITFAHSNDALVTLGISPTSPHTGYGYIEAKEKVSDRVVPALRFIEKPDEATAQQFLKSGTFYWNCGIFFWSLRSIRRAFEAFLPEDWSNIMGANTNSELETTFKKLKSQPIDKAVLEKAKNVFVLGAENLGWNDVGSWNAVYELRGKDNGNACVQGKLETIESSGCLVNVSPDKKVALIGVKDLIVVEANGRLLIMARDHDQSVRQIAEKDSSLE